MERRSLCWIIPFFKMKNNRLITGEREPQPQKCTWLSEWLSLHRINHFSFKKGIGTGDLCSFSFFYFEWWIGGYFLSNISFEPPIRSTIHKEKEKKRHDVISCPLISWLLHQSYFLDSIKINFLWKKMKLILNPEKIGESRDDSWSD